MPVNRRSIPETASGHRRVGGSPTGGYFGHDKVEGVATTDGGRTLVVANDSDFGISGLTNGAAPFQLKAKILPNGKQDDGSFLVVDMSKLDGSYSSTATVTITVTTGKR